MFVEIIYRKILKSEVKVMKNEYTVRFNWDDEAKVWIATSNDIIGLILESESVEKLMNRVKLAAPELIELNHLPKYNSVKFEIEERLEFA